MAIISVNVKSNVSASWLVRELTGPRLDWPRVVCRRVVRLAFHLYSTSDVNKAISIKAKAVPVQGQAKAKAKF